MRPTLRQLRVTLGNYLQPPIPPSSQNPVIEKEDGAGLLDENGNYILKE